MLLPNTAGCQTAEEAVRVARLARAGGLPDWIKLEVIPDPRYLLPDPVETLRAAETLVADGFTVLPYVLPDPVLGKRLEEAGCATVMPLAAPIGTGRGLKLLEAIRILIEECDVPVVVDAGLGAPSHAAAAMELGADAVLVNTAIACAGDPVAMARGFRLAVEAGRAAYRAGIMEERVEAAPSSPVGGLVTSASG
jgi:thiazole synthase